MKKNRLIEVSFPSQEISRISSYERIVKRGHIATLHIWWSRKPLTASRATIYASFVEEEGKETLKRLSDVSILKEGTNDVIEKAKDDIRKFVGYVPKILDPFAGGGSIPLEAQRL